MEVAQAPAGLEIRLAPYGREDAVKVITLKPGEPLRESIVPHMDPPEWDDELALFNSSRGRCLEPGEPPEDQPLSRGDLVLIGDQEDLPDPLAPYVEALGKVRSEGGWPPADEALFDLASMRTSMGVEEAEHQRLARRAGFDDDEARLLHEAKASRDRQRDEYVALVRLLVRPAPGAAVTGRRAGRPRVKTGKEKVAPPPLARPPDPGLLRRLARLRETLGMTVQDHLAICSQAGIAPGQAEAILGTAPPGDPEYRAVLVRAREQGYEPAALDAVRQNIRERKIGRDLHAREAQDLQIDAATALALYDDRLDRPPGWRFYLAALLEAAELDPLPLQERAGLEVLRGRYAITPSLHHVLAREFKVPPRRAGDLLGAQAPSPLSPLRLVGLVGLAGLCILLTAESGRAVVDDAAAELATLFGLRPRYAPDGYDTHGYDKAGYDRRGYSREGLDRRGFDRQGFDRKGYNRQGVDRHGFNRQGFDRGGFDRHGFDKDGYGRDGFDRQGRSRDGLDRKGYGRDGFAADGYDARGFDRKGFDRKGRDKDGFDRHGFDDVGFDRKGFNRLGRDRQGFDRKGFDRQGFNRAGLDVQGFNRQGLDRYGYNRLGYDKEGYDRAGYDKDGYDRQGFNREGVNQDGFNREGRDREGYDREGYDRQGYNRLGLDRRGRDRQGRDRFGFDKDGLDREGYDRRGHDRKGFNRQGFDRDGYDRDGFNREGFDRSGLNRQGFDRHGVGAKGQDLLPFRFQVLESQGSYVMVVAGGATHRVGQRVGANGVLIERIAPSAVKFSYRGFTYERRPSR